MFILNGGGDAQQSAPADALFAARLARRTLLYVPQAVSPDPWPFDRALEWLKAHAAFTQLDITMWRELDGRHYGDLDDFDALYLMGGNTFVLLQALRSSGFDDLITKFVTSKRVVHGISAGAIVLGMDIGTAALGDEADENTPQLTNLRGLGLLGPYLVHTHYTDNDATSIAAFASQGADTRQVICIPEDTAVIVDEREATVIGHSQITIFSGNESKQHRPDDKFRIDPPASKSE